MFFAAMKNLGPFIFKGFLSIFSLFQYILSIETEDAENTYPGVNSFIRMLI
jgi:hypothetical protein